MSHKANVSNAEKEAKLDEPIQTDASTRSLNLYKIGNKLSFVKDSEDVSPITNEEDTDNDPMMDQYKGRIS